jgi:iron(III) transport system ATP-binding protein
MNGGGLRLQRVSHLYGDTSALSGVSLALPAGVATAILGPSGCGKTTVLRLLAGLESPSEGQVLLDDQVVSDEGRTLVPPHLRGVAMVFQDLALWPNLSALQNVMLGLVGLALHRRRRERRALEALEACGIGELAATMPAQLSGGQQQRVAIARAVAPQPRFLLLDEPFSSLDLILKDQLFGDLSTLVRDSGLTLVLVTHDPMEATSLCDHAVVLEEGRMVEAGRLSALLQCPGSRFLRVFRSQLPRLIQ